MKTLIERLSGLVKYSISGFDRIVFKGYILPLMIANGAMDFCRRNGILNKNYKQWMLSHTKCLVQTIDQYAKENCGQGIIPIPTYRIRKEALAHQHQKDKGIKNGLIGVWSCLESGSSFRAHYCAKSGYPQLKNYWVSCNNGSDTFFDQFIN